MTNNSLEDCLGGLDVYLIRHPRTISIIQGFMGLMLNVWFKKLEMFLTSAIFGSPELCGACKYATVY